MKNATDIKLAPVFQSGARPVEPVQNLADLKNIGEAFVNYGIGVGEIIQFPEYKNAQVFAQPVRAGSEAKQYIVAVKRIKGDKSVDSYFSLNTLMKRDHNNVAVHTKWYEMENMDARLQALCNAKAIKGTSEITIKVPVFNGGQRVYTEITGSDGVPMQVGMTKEQKVVLFEECGE